MIEIVTVEGMLVIQAVPDKTEGPKRQRKQAVPITGDDIEAAARILARANGVNPDKMTCKERPVWQVYRDDIEAALKAIREAKAALT